MNKDSSENSRQIFQSVFPKPDNVIWNIRKGCYEPAHEVDDISSFIAQQYTEKLQVWQASRQSLEGQEPVAWMVQLSDKSKHVYFTAEDAKYWSHLGDYKVTEIFTNTP